MRRLAPGLLALLLLPAVAAAEGDNAPVLVRSDGQGAVLELAVTGHRVEAVAGGEVPYQTVTLPDLEPEGAPGEPEVPVAGALVALPPDTVPVLTVEAAEYDVLPAHRLAPVPSVVVPADPVSGTEATMAYAESAVYGTDAFLPGPVASLGFTGSVRGQPVAQVRFHPVQFNPVRGEVRLYGRIRVRLDFVPDGETSRAKAGPEPGPGDTGPFEAIRRRGLLGYPAGGR